MPVMTKVCNGKPLGKSDGKVGLFSWKVIRSVTTTTHD